MFVGKNMKKCDIGFTVLVKKYKINETKANKKIKIEMFYKHLLKQLK